MLFEVRSNQLQWQPGEICFPGGRIEATDSTPQATAIRETMEELELQSDKIKVLGPLDEVISPIGVALYPFVGLVNSQARLNPNRDEVAAVFTVPFRIF